jgi:hypothetical protein
VGWIGVVLAVGAAFGGDGGAPVLFAGPAPLGHHGGLVAAAVGVSRPVSERTGGDARCRKHHGAGGVGDVFLAVGASPDDGAIAELFVCPAPEGLEQMVAASV